MNLPLRFFGICLLTAIVGCSSPPTPQNVVAEDPALAEIKQAIVYDSAIEFPVFWEGLFEGNFWKLLDHDDHSLTFSLINLVIKDDTIENESFKFVDPRPRQTDVAEELCRLRHHGKRNILMAPVTFIHADRITSFDCKIEGDAATGAVSFEVPDMYKGKAEFVAAKVNDQWRITEFRLPARDIHLKQGDEGKWEKAN